MRKWVDVVAAVGMAAMALSVPGAAGEDRPAASADRTLGPLISGTSSYVDGTYAWTDYAYDDRGSNTDPLPGGDSTYPASVAPGNAADLIQVQVALTTDHELRVTAVLETLLKAEHPEVGIGFDTDANRLSGASSVPGGGWNTRTPLGLEAMVVLRGNGARLLKWEGVAWHDAGPVASTADLAANTLSAVVPRDQLAAPTEGAWRVVAAAGLAPAADSWVAGKGPIYDLAFVRAEDPYGESAYAVVDAAQQVKGQATAGGSASAEWQDHRQADVLAGMLDPSNAVGVVDFKKLTTGVTELATATEQGYHTFLYYSPLNFGEGIQTGESSLGGSIRFGGPYQPYLVRLPAARHGAMPMLMFLHGANQNHLQTANYFTPSLTDRISPGSFDPQAIVAFPLGRDPSWSSHAAEQDLIDVAIDVGRRYPIDPDRVVLSGISNGGAGTFRYAQLYPDKWAGAYALAGADGTGLLENMRNLSFRMQNGAADPLVGPTSWLPSTQALDQLKTVDYLSFVPMERSHVPVPALGNCIYLEFLNRGRAIDPPRVVYRVDPANEVDDKVTGLRLSHTGAYWVSGLRLRGATPGGVDATSLARAVRSTVATTVEKPGENLSAGADYCGPNPAVRTGDVWRTHGVALTPGAAMPTENRVDVRLTQLRAAALDLIGAGLAADRPVTIRVTGDGRTRLALLAGWKGNTATVTRDFGSAVSTPVKDGRLVIDADLAGTHTYVITQ